jgi:hypothetical protein
VIWMPAVALKIGHLGADDEDMFEFVRDAASVTTFPRAS